MTAITVQSPISIAVPRASRWAAAAFIGLLNWLEQHHALRAERQLQADRIAEACAVREYARRYATHDPRFAADLLAAADRHERAD
jgi:hypothetical protein